MNEPTNHSIESIFYPGKQVEVFVEYPRASDSRSLRRAVIRDCRYKQRTIVISQTEPMVTSFARRGDITLSSVVRSDGGPVRLGLSCRILQFVDGPLNSGPCIELQYKGPLQTTNLRRSYRFAPGPVYHVAQTIRLDTSLLQGDNPADGEKKTDDEVETGIPACLNSGADFAVQDLSCHGIGLIFSSESPVLRHLRGMSPTHQTLKVELEMTDFEQEDSRKNSTALVSATVRVTHLHKLYGRSDVLVGTEFVDLSKEDEERIGRFVTAGQLYEIRSARRGSVPTRILFL